MSRTTIEEQIVGAQIAAGYGYDYRGGRGGDVPVSEDPVRTIRGFSSPFPSTVDPNSTVLVDRTRIPPDWQVADEHVSVYEHCVLNDMGTSAVIRMIANNPNRDQLWSDISLKFFGTCKLGDLIAAFNAAGG
jgi:hypothetical protein